jgi:membrane-associated phospholipid phosphatase
MSIPPVYLHIIYIAAFVLMMELNVFYKQPLYDYSILLIQDLHLEITPISLSVCQALAIVGDGPIYMMLFLLFCSRGPRADAFLYICLIGLCNSIMALTKNGLHDPRPYFSNDSIKAFDCSHEYGNPSGHSLFVSGAFVFMFLNYFHNSNSKQISIPLYIAALVGTLMFICLMGFSRVYVGVHSID